jgi:myosin-crossreactive antigen
MQYQGNLPQLRRPQSTEESLVDQTAIYIEDCVGHGGSAWPAWTVAKSRHGDHPTVRMVIFQRISRTGGSDDGDFVADLTHRQR